MNWSDMFKPYSPKIWGDLKEYLKRHDGLFADNHFYGPKYFFVMKEMGLILPFSTSVRVARNPAPDEGYIVNKDFLLESGGRGEDNMSLVGGERGIYDPADVLKKEHWSISDLKID